MDVKISQAGIDLPGERVADTEKQAVLIEPMTPGGLSRVNMKLIINEEKWNFWPQGFSFKRNRPRNVVTETPVEVVIVNRLSVRIFLSDTFLRANVLRKPESVARPDPLKLLPGAVF